MPCAKQETSAIPLSSTGVRVVDGDNIPEIVPESDTESLSGREPETASLFFDQRLVVEWGILIFVVLGKDLAYRRESRNTPNYPKQTRGCKARRYGSFQHYSRLLRTIPNTGSPGS